jgi:fructokinase
LRLFDVNLRVTFFDAESLRCGAELATAIKLNEDEMPVVLRLLGLDAGIAVATSSNNVNADQTLADRFHQAAARRLLVEFSSHDLTTVVVTRGARGTALITRDDVVCGPVAQFARHPQADNVGAGDACSAGLLWGWLNHWEAQEAVTLANRLGAFVASQPGATPPIPDDVLDLPS